jgi:hypothetical protein
VFVCNDFRFCRKPILLFLEFCLSADLFFHLDSSLMYHSLERNHRQKQE